jgi:hypothetical protein
MKKRFFAGALTALALGFLAVAPTQAATNSENSVWNNSRLNNELGFTCNSNPTLANLGTSFNTSVYMMDAAPRSVEVAVIPAMNSGNCKYLLPSGSFTLDYIELKLYPEYNSLSNEVIETVRLNPENALSYTFEDLDPGEDYAVWYRPMFLNTETNEYYTNSQRRADIHTIFPMKPKYYKLRMKKDGTVTLKMKRNNPAYSSRSNAKARILLLNSKRKKRNVKAPVVKYFTGGSRNNVTTGFEYFRFADVFAPRKKKVKKNFLVYKVSPKVFLDVLKDGEIQETTDLETFKPKKWNVHRFTVKRNGQRKKLKRLKNLRAKASCNITRCQLR